MKVSTLLILISLFTIATLTNAQVNTADIGCPCDATIVDRGEFMRCVNVGTKELKQTSGIDKRAYKRLRKQYKKRAAKCEFGKEETSEDGDDQPTLDSGDGDSDDGEKKDCTTVTKVNQCNKTGGGICSWVDGNCIDNLDFIKGGGGTSSNGGGQGGQGGNGGGGGGNMNAGSNNSKPMDTGNSKPINNMNAGGGGSKPNGGNGNNNKPKDKPNGQSGSKPMITGGMNVGGESNTKPNGQGGNGGGGGGNMNASGGEKPMNGGGNTKPNGGRPPWAGQGDSEDGEDTETTEDSEDTETSVDGVSSGADGDGGQQKDCSLITKSNQCTNKWGGTCSWIGGTCVGNTVAVSKQTSLQEADGTIPQPLNSSIKVKGKFSSLIFYAAAMMFYQA